MTWFNSVNRKHCHFSILYSFGETCFFKLEIWECQNKLLKTDQPPDRIALRCLCRYKLCISSVWRLRFNTPCPLSYCFWAGASSLLVWSARRQAWPVANGAQPSQPATPVWRIFNAGTASETLAQHWKSVRPVCGGGWAVRSRWPGRGDSRISGENSGKVESNPVDSSSRNDVCPAGCGATGYEAASHGRYN